MQSNVACMRPARQFTQEQAAAFAATLGAMVNAGLELLDVVGGDPDAEPNGDEGDGPRGEDDFCEHFAGGPGCPLSDPDTAVDDQPCDPEAEDGL